MIRACSDKKCASDDENCATCDKNKCNSGIFPEDRQSCLQCDSLSVNDDCAKGSNITSELCRSYNKDDKCHLYVDENNMIHRGCSSDQGNCTSETRCEECVGEGCNKKPLYQEAARSCVTCLNCTDKLPDEEKCSSTHLYYLKEECYTQNVTEGNITTTNRGCLNDLTNQESCGANCTRCETDGCNKYGDDYKEFPEFKCIICNGSNDEDCLKSEPKHCLPVPTTLNRGVGCFVERRGDVIIRDCLTNAEHWNTTLNSKNVVTCTTDSCNTMAAPGSAVTIQLSSGLLVAVIALLFSLNNII